MKILITGATGLVGKEVGKSLVRDGHQIVVISRNKQKALHDLPFPCEIIEGDLNQGPVPELKNLSIQAVIHLAGENLAQRWTQKAKQRIRDSRVLGTENLIASFSPKLFPEIVISTSAVGYYGDRGHETLNEDSNAGEDFLAKLCVDWEAPWKKVTDSRVCIIRLGMVLSPFGGAIKKMLGPFLLGLGGVLGSGDQYISWIHIRDVVDSIRLLLTHSSAKGIFNLTSPLPVTNREFTQSLNRALGKNGGPAAPAPALKLALGEMSTVVLSSQNVRPEKLTDLGYKYSFSEIDRALEDICALYKEGDSVFYVEQFFPYTRDQVFTFFSKAQNLEKITPPWLNFKIEKISEEKVKAGTLIDYKLKIHGIPASWQTRIETWNPPTEFTDIQLKGPYRKWHHSHKFYDLGTGTLMTDLVRYQFHLGKIGWVASAWMVEKDINKIFAFRRDSVAKQKF